jgi:hypothetical protein
LSDISGRHPRTPSFPGERSPPPAPLPRRRTARAALGRCAIVIMGGTDPARAPRLGRVRRYGLPAACCGFRHTSGIPLLRPSRDSLRVGSAHGTTAVARLTGPQFGADRRFQTSLAGIRERGRALERNPASRSLPYLVTPAMEFSLRSAPPSRPSAFPLARSNQAHRSAASVVAGRAFTGQRAECALITGQGSPDRVRTGAWPHDPIHV